MYKPMQLHVQTSQFMAPVMQQLPEFPPPEGERRPMSFRRVLLNTCQEEFEGAAAAREVSRPKRFTKPCVHLRLECYIPGIAA